MTRLSEGGPPAQAGGEAELAAEAPTPLSDPVSRRRVLKGLGAAVAAMAATGASLSALSRFLTGTANAEDASHDDHAGYQWGFVIDLRRCDGCKECTLACQQTHYLPRNQEWIKVYEIEGEGGHKWFMPRPCMQCEHAPCLKVCPVRATFKNKEGVILIDQQRCIGCRVCMAACPYNARYFNFWEPPKPPPGWPDPMPEFPVPQQRGTVGKCVFCVHYAEAGRLPACIDACRMDSLYLVELNSDIMTNRSGETYKFSTYIREHDAFRFREELNTSPRVWYIPGHGQTLGVRYGA